MRWAPRRTAAQLRGDLAAEAIRLDPEDAERACERGTSERDVHLRPSPLPGCRRLVADLPMVAANACWLALNGAARTARGAEGRNGRPLPQLRADVLTAVLTGSIAAAGAAQGFDRGYDRSGHDRNGHDRNGEQPSDSRQPADVPTQDELSRHIEIRVVVSADTLSRARDLPGSLPGVGPLDPGTVRALAARSPWRRLVADPVSGTLLHADRHLLQPAAPEPLGGAPTADPDHEGGEDPSSDPRLAALLAQPVMPERLDHGIDRYRPSPSLRMHVLTRDGTCVGPACHHPTGGSQLDHTTNYGERAPDGTVGTTSHTNLGALCARTHNSKTHGGWDLGQPAPGSFTWTSPTGRTYSRACRPLVHGWSADGETDAALGDSG